MASGILGTTWTDSDTQFIKSIIITVDTSDPHSITEPMYRVATFGDDGIIRTWSNTKSVKKSVGMILSLRRLFDIEWDRVIECHK